MMNFDYIFNDIFDSFNDLSPITYYTSVSGFPTEKEIVNAIKSGEISEKCINIAVRRILSCKYSYGIIE